MPDFTPIYTKDNSRFAAPLQWSLSIFWREPELADDWQSQLTKDLEPDVDLSQMQRTSHGVFWYNLHLVFVHRERWNEVRHEILARVQSMVLAVAKKKSHRLARAGILPDHVHLVLGCPFDMSPCEVALGFLNNFAFVHGMKPVYQFGAFVGTVGEYTNKAF